MWAAATPLVLMAQLLRREILVPAEAEPTEQNAEPVKSEWPLKECDERPHVGQRKQENPLRDGCVCTDKYQVCQPLQLSAWVNDSVTLLCNFTYHQDWEPSSEAGVHWRLDSFHSSNYLFNRSKKAHYTHTNFSGRVSLARQERGNYTAAIRITALKESDSRLYFCRVSVKIKGGKREMWQTVNGTNLTVTAPPPQPEGRDARLLFGMLTGAGLLAAAIILGLLMFLLAWRKGHCQKSTQTRRAVGQRQKGKEMEYEEIPLRGAAAPPLAAPGSRPLPNSPQLHGESGLVYATVALSAARSKTMPLKPRGQANEETTYAAVRP